MKKLILLLALVSQVYSYTMLNLLSCDLELGGYRGVYKSFSGQIYVMKFQNYCPYTYTIK